MTVSGRTFDKAVTMRRLTLVRASMETGDVSVQREYCLTKNARRLPARHNANLAIDVPIFARILV